MFFQFTNAGLRSNPCLLLLQPRLLFAVDALLLVETGLPLVLQGDDGLSRGWVVLDQLAVLRRFRYSFQSDRKHEIRTNGAGIRRPDFMV